MTGYGRYPDSAYVHRVEWMKHYGITDLQVNHLCVNKNCYEITHLYAGTPSQNAEDSLRDGTHFFASKTSCPLGHPYDEENTMINAGSRKCRVCQNANTERWRVANKDTLRDKKREYQRTYRKKKKEQGNA